jgi:hypothetical protein
VDDWGTKYNITSNMMTEGIRSIHERGGKVVLAYGGTGAAQGGTGVNTGITAQQGGGDVFYMEESRHARSLADRIYKNIVDWDLDGVDFFNAEASHCYWHEHCQGTSVPFHLEVIGRLRRLVGNTKTISYTTLHQPFGYNSGYHYHERYVIAACHHLLDYITTGYGDNVLSPDTLDDLAFFGVPLSKIGLLLEIDYDFPTSNATDTMIDQVRQINMASWIFQHSAMRYGLGVVGASQF